MTNAATAATARRFICTPPSKQLAEQSARMYRNAAARDY
jgi:hypothetical protein